MEKSRPTQNSYAVNTEDQILKQAMRLFLKKGYHGTSIDEITRAAGLTKGALYWHFKKKEDLLKIIVEDFEKRFLNKMIKKVNEVKGGAIDKFDTLIRHNAAFAYYNRELCVSFTTLSAELVGGHHPIESEIQRIYKKYQRFLSKLILQGKNEKVLKKEIDPEVAALIIIGFYDGILLQWSMNKDEVDGKLYVRTFRKIILEGLKA